MRRKILLALIVAALLGSSPPNAPAQTNDADMKQQQPPQYVVASPNPRPGKVLVEKLDGELEVTELQPAAAVKASPLKSKRKRKARTTKPRP